MHKFFFISLLILCLGCKNKITPNKLDLLNGYWSIDYITHNNETFYPKGASKLLDFYEVNNREGVRKKIQPQLDDKFLVTDDLNNFKVIFKDENCYLNFRTVWDQWQEKIVVLSKKKLILEHQEKRYHYKKFDSEY